MNNDRVESILIYPGGRWARRMVRIERIVNIETATKQLAAGEKVLVSLDDKDEVLQIAKKMPPYDYDAKQEYW